MMRRIVWAQFRQTRYSKKDNIKSPMHYLDEIKKSLKVNLIEGDTLPWTKTHDNLRFRPSEVTLWHGYSGHKKSMVLGYAAMNFAYSGHPVCIASFEMKPVKTLIRLLKQASGTVTPTEYALDNFANHFDNKLWIYDKMGKFQKSFEVPWTPVTPFDFGKKRENGGAAVALDLSHDSTQKWMYLINQQTSQVDIIERETGKIVSSFGRSGHFPGEFDQPHGIAVDSKGSVYVAENRGRRIQKFKMK